MADYEFYQGQYYGSAISQEDWPAARREAEAVLSRYERIYTVTGDDFSRDMAVCALADTLCYYADAQTLSSASIGSVSETRASVDLSPQAQSKALYAAASRYLEIYRGVRGC